MCVRGSISLEVVRLSFPASVAAGIVRGVNGVSRRTGRGLGTVLGGRVGLALNPRLLQRLARGRDAILVTGTNGKTTTTAMITAGWGHTVATNRTGANMPAGLVAALAQDANKRAVLEVDEAYLGRALDEIGPTVTVVLNLSRDQLDRATEVRSLAQRWQREFANGPRGVVVANASDPLVVYAVAGAPKVRWVAAPQAWREDTRSCPNCTQPLRFDETWSCACGLREPAATTTIDDDGAITIDGVSVALELHIPGFFNRVNAAFALTALAERGVPIRDAVERLMGIEAVAGRYEHRMWRGRRVRLLLAKNPAGAAALVAACLGTTDELWLSLNSGIADGRDPSWIYDAPFEQLAGRTVYCLGERRLDMATRLTYGGVDAVVVDDLATVTGRTADVTVIANYTAFRTMLAESSPC